MSSLSDFAALVVAPAVSDDVQVSVNGEATKEAKRPTKTTREEKN